MNWRNWVFVVLVIVAAVMGYFYWQMFWQGGGERVTGEKFLENYETLMKADTVGGQTPEETLKMFIDALRKEDVALAAQYFLLDDEGKRDKWLVYLQDIKDKGLMQKMVEDLEGARPNLENIISETDHKFLVETEEGATEVNMEFNKFSGVWKIESL